MIPKEIGINQFIFEHPFFITHIVIQFGTIPYKYKILYSYDSISYKEATKEIDLCDIAYSNINAIEFKKPLYAKEIRILTYSKIDGIALNILRNLSHDVEIKIKDSSYFP